MPDDRCELLCLDLPLAEELRRQRPAAWDLERTAEKARALGDPTRLILAATLARIEELCVCDLAWISERSVNLVSHHLRTLRSAGLVESRRLGKMVMYSLTGTGRELANALVGVAAVDGAEWAP